jgi:C4-type Zn-finger protein
MNYQEAFALARPIVQEFAMRLRQNSNDTMACPACGGNLRVHRYGFDGKIAKTAAHCDTAFCIQWTE